MSAKWTLAEIRHRLKKGFAVTGFGKRRWLLLSPDGRYFDVTPQSTLAGPDGSRYITVQRFRVIPKKVSTARRRRRPGGRGDGATR
jgi:hypothetical protein